MVEQYKYKGEVFPIDDSKGCYIEVTYKDQVGYLGVNLEGTGASPYGWYTDLQQRRSPSAEGLKPVLDSGTDPEKLLPSLLDKMLANQKLHDERLSFKREEACENLHSFFKSIVN